MKILLDIGNTSAKIVVADNKVIVHFERRKDGWDKVFHRLTAQFPIDECIISNVAGVDKELLRTLETQPYPVTWLTYETPNPIHPDIKAPRGLGADRWAADIGAMAIAEETGNSNTNILVIDAGTCITYDFIDNRGEITKGAISPGVELRIKAMHEHTALLPLVNVEGDVDILGFDTETSMRSGAVIGAALETEGFIRRLRRQYPDLRVFVTGGNIFDYDDDVKGCITTEPMLIFKGLMQIANW